MGKAVGQKTPQIAMCRRCGRIKKFHPEGIEVCPVSDEAILALRRFAEVNGRKWRLRLKHKWEEDLTSLSFGLIEAYEKIGPVRIAKVDVFVV